MPKPNRLAVVYLSLFPFVILIFSTFAIAANTPSSTASLLGLHVQALTPEIQRQVQTSNGQGVIVSKVSPGSSAAKAGLRRGDIIREANRSKIDDMAAYEKMVSPHDSNVVLFLIERGGNSLYVALNPQAVYQAKKQPVPKKSLANDSKLHEYVAQLFQVGQKSSPSRPVNKCDTLAAFPLDPARRADGLDMEKIDIKRAFSACTDALADAPDDPVSLFQMGRIYHKSNDIEKALKYYKSAAEKQHAAAFCNIGYIYLGDGRHRNQQVKSFQWFEKGASLDAPVCQFMVGRFYRIGFSGEFWTGMMKKDHRKSRYWLEKAYKNGYEEAREELKLLKSQPTRDMAESLGKIFGGGFQGSPSAPKEKRPCTGHPQIDSLEGGCLDSR